MAMQCKDAPLWLANLRPCSSDQSEKYLNAAEVQAAIHAKHTKWSQCSSAVGRAYNETDLNQPMMPYWQHLIQTPGVSGFL